MYIPAHGLIRRFILFTSPNIADPAWMVPVVEVDGDGNEVASFTDIGEVKGVVDKMERDLIINRVRMTAEAETLQKTLDILGVTREEYEEKWRKSWKSIVR